MHRSFWVSEKVNKPVINLFLGSLRKLYNDFNPTDVYVVWDARLIKGVKNYRRQNESYKADRDKEKWKKVYAKEKIIRKLIDTLGLYNMYPGILEADDFIYYICKNTSGNKVVVTSDQDLLQVIDNDTSVYNPIKKLVYDINKFEETFKISLSDFISYKALIGDKSDNIQGIAGVGPKRALKMLTRGVTKCLTPDENKIFKHNVDMIDLTRGIDHHPEEVSIYKYQMKHNTNIQSDYNSFLRLCEDCEIELQYDFTCFFANHINTAVADILNECT